MFLCLWRERKHSCAIRGVNVSTVFATIATIILVLFSYVFASGRLTRQPTRTRAISPPHRGKSQRTQTTTHVEHQAHPSITPKASAKNAPPGFLFLDGQFQSNVAWEGRFQSQASSMNEKKLSNIKSRSADVARNEGMTASRLGASQPHLSRNRCGARDV